MSATIKTADMYLSAYLLTKHIPLQGVMIEKRDRRKVVFIFPKTKTSEALLEAARQGIAMVNLLEFKARYQHVQDLLYESQRQQGLR